MATETENHESVGFNFGRQSDSTYKLTGIRENLDMFFMERNERHLTSLNWNWQKVSKRTDSTPTSDVADTIESGISSALSPLDNTAENIESRALSRLQSRQRLREDLKNVFYDRWKKVDDKQKQAVTGRSSYPMKTSSRSSRQRCQFDHRNSLPDSNGSSSRNTWSRHGHYPPKSAIYYQDQTRFENSHFGDRSYPPKCQNRHEISPWEHKRDTGREERKSQNFPEIRRINSKPLRYWNGKETTGRGDLCTPFEYRRPRAVTTDSHRSTYSMHDFSQEERVLVAENMLTSFFAGRDGSNLGLQTAEIWHEDSIITSKTKRTVLAQFIGVEEARGSQDNSFSAVEDEVFHQSDHLEEIRTQNAPRQFSGSADGDIIVSSQRSGRLLNTPRFRAFSNRRSASSDRPDQVTKTHVESKLIDDVQPQPEPSFPACHGNIEVDIKHDEIMKIQAKKSRSPSPRNESISRVSQAPVSDPNSEQNQKPAAEKPGTVISSEDRSSRECPSPQPDSKNLQIALAKEKSIDGTPLDSSVAQGRMVEIITSQKNCDSESFERQTWAENTGIYIRSTTQNDNAGELLATKTPVQNSHTAIEINDGLDSSEKNCSLEQSQNATINLQTDIRSTADLTLSKNAVADKKVLKHEGSNVVPSQLQSRVSSSITRGIDSRIENHISTRRNGKATNLPKCNEALSAQDRSTVATNIEDSLSEHRSSTVDTSDDQSTTDPHKPTHDREQYVSNSQQSQECCTLQPERSFSHSHMNLVANQANSPNVEVAELITSSHPLNENNREDIPSGQNTEGLCAVQEPSIPQETRRSSPVQSTEQSTVERAKKDHSKQLSDHLRDEDSSPVQYEMDEESLQIPPGVTDEDVAMTSDISHNITDSCYITPSIKEKINAIRNQLSELNEEIDSKIDDPKPVTEQDERPSVYIIKNPGLDLISSALPEEYLEIDLDQDSATYLRSMGGMPLETSFSRIPAPQSSDRKPDSQSQEGNGYRTRKGGTSQASNDSIISLERNGHSGGRENEPIKSSKIDSVCELVGDGVENCDPNEWQNKPLSKNTSTQNEERQHFKSRVSTQSNTRSSGVSSRRSETNEILTNECNTAGVLELKKKRPRSRDSVEKLQDSSVSVTNAVFRRSRKRISSVDKNEGEEFASESERDSGCRTGDGEESTSTRWKFNIFGRKSDSPIEKDDIDSISCVSQDRSRRFKEDINLEDDDVIVTTGKKRTDSAGSGSANCKQQVSEKDDGTISEISDGYIHEKEDSFEKTSFSNHSEIWTKNSTKRRRSLLEGLGTSYCVVPKLIWKYVGQDTDDEPMTRKKCVAFILGSIVAVLLLAILLGLIIGIATSSSTEESSPIRFTVIPGIPDDQGIEENIDEATAE